jgi:hypothetical protein
MDWAGLMDEALPTILRMAEVGVGVWVFTVLVAATDYLLYHRKFLPSNKQNVGVLMEKQAEIGKGLCLKRNVGEAILITDRSGSTIQITLIKISSGERPSATLHCCGDKEQFKITRTPL